jgi:hypothetical protein
LALANSRNVFEENVKDTDDLLEMDGQLRRRSAAEKLVLARKTKKRMQDSTDGVDGRVSGLDSGLETSLVERWLRIRGHWRLFEARTQSRI